MLDKLEELLENTKIYVVIGMIVMLCVDAIMMANLYDDYGSIFGGNDALDKVIWIFLIITGILVVLTVVLSVILRIWQGELYLTVFDYLETFMYIVFPVDARSKKEIRESLNQLGNEDEIRQSALWKSMKKGIHVLNLVKTVFLLWFASMIVYVVIEGWLDKSDDRIVMTVLGLLFAIIMYFWALVCGVGIKKRPDEVLSYCEQHELSFHTLDEDFFNAQKYGLDMYIGREFVFIDTGKGMQVAKRNEIVRCDVLRMGGWNPRRLFLSYYILDIETAETHIVKYGISPMAFYKVKNAIG